MFFKKKAKKETKCEHCKKSFSDHYNFCPFCGYSSIENDDEDFGMLGKRDMGEDELQKRNNGQNDFSIMDKIIGQMVQSMMKNMMTEMNNKPEVNTFPNGIKIQINAPQKKQVREVKSKDKVMSEAQIEKMAQMPRVKATSNVKRLADKIIYELDIPGIRSPEDIFVSKLETGYEIKAIGEGKVYVNSLPLELPIRGFAINKDKLLVEFAITQQAN